MSDHRSSTSHRADGPSPFTGADVLAPDISPASGYTGSASSQRPASQTMTQQLLMIEDDTRLAAMVGEYLS
ncbi:MAG: hypothetical protein Q8S16_09120 [Polaromonas sp.]|nr:hypothetical protein [Polaromonas sp.]